MSDRIEVKNIIDEMNNSFLDYAMSVIVSRALPDVRDGLKPVHRRILYAMNDLGNTSDKPYKKSARIVGDVIGKYHPHGDTSVYDAMVRMSQDFSYRLPLVDGHGNFGSLDGDGAAAMRYTEARMAKITMELLKDINKDTIDFQDNYDGSEQEPVVLPAKFPNLLVNGASGIAVGMATSIPPHNLGEVIDGTIAYLDNREIEISELMTIIKGPDFPLGANILGRSGIKKAYETGHGSVKVRSEYDVFEEKSGKSTIIISEIPFQVNKAVLVEKIADCVKDKRVEGITDLRDESDRDGVRIVIELSKTATPDIVMNNLFKYTQLESSFSLNMLALVGGVPKILNLKQFLVHYTNHQIEVITRKTKFELKRAQDRAHILEGLKIALGFIDEVIEIIKSSRTQDEAIKKLEEKYSLTERQSKAILEMQLRRLTGLEQEKIENELAELLKTIEELNSILASPEKIDEIIKETLIEIREKYANDRRTKILDGYFDSGLDYEELIEEENTIVTLTTSGYIKRISPDEYKTQNRGGKGTIGVKLNDEDIVSNVLHTSTHSDLLFFTNTGRVFKTRTHRVPLYSKTAKGLPLVNLIELEDNEKITNILSTKDYPEHSYLLIVTKHGLGKKTNIMEYERINKNGKIAISLNEGDEVVGINIIEDHNNVFIATKNAKILHCKASDFRQTGRTAKGVRAIRLSSDDEVISADLTNDNEFIVNVSENGFGKATIVDEYRIQKRGGKGITSQKISDKTGRVVASLKMDSEQLENDDLLMITDLGQVIRISANDIKKSGRTTMGVTLMRMSDNDHIANVEVISIDKEEEIIEEDGQDEEV